MALSEKHEDSSRSIEPDIPATPEEALARTDKDRPAVPRRRRPRNEPGSYAILLEKRTKELAATRKRIAELQQRGRLRDHEYSRLYTNYTEAVSGLKEADEMIKARDRLLKEARAEIDKVVAQVGAAEKAADAVNYRELWLRQNGYIERVRETDARFVLVPLTQDALLPLPFNRFGPVARSRDGQK